MAGNTNYRINIRSADNSAWINLLDATYVHHNNFVTGIGTSATNTTELALKFLFDNKVQRVIDTVAPTANDGASAGYQVGALWVDVTTQHTYLCYDNTDGNAVWHTTGFTLEEIQDIVGDMVDSDTGSVQNGIAVTYDDVNGKLNFDVNDPTITLSGDVNGSAVMTDLGDVTINTTISGGYYTQAEADDRFVNVTGDTMTGPLAINSTLSLSAGVSIDEISADGTLAGNSDTAIPTEQAVKTYVDSKISGLDWRGSVISASASAPPASPNTGDRYLLISGSLSGDWIGHDDQVAEWDGSAWVYTTPDNGWTLHVNDEQRYYSYNGNVGSWVALGTEVRHNALIGLQGGSGNDEYFHLSNAEYTSITGTKTQNYVFASPDGAAGTGSFRALVSDDIPTLLSSKISDFVEAAQDATGALISAGSQQNITVTYDDANNKIDFAVNTGVAASASDAANAGVVSFNDSQFTVDSNGYVSFISSGTIDHGSLLGLGDDDHTQYVHVSIARTISAIHEFAPSTASAPFTLGANAQGQLVTGLNADMVDGQNWGVSSTAPTTTQANDIWIQII